MPRYIRETWRKIITPTLFIHSAQGFLKNLLHKAPFVIAKILTDNGKEFTDRFCATGQRQPTGNHLFDKVCAAHNIEPRLIKPRHPQTNGMVERFNGKIEGILGQTRFTSASHLKDSLLKYNQLYNHHIAQKLLGHITPIQALKNWQKTHPNLFKNQSIISRDLTPNHPHPKLPAIAQS